MRSATLKWVVLTATLVIGLIIAIQLYWLKHIYQLEQKQFDTNVVKCIRGLFEDLELSDSPEGHLQQMVTLRPSSNVFVIRIDRLPSGNELVKFITRELLDFNILTKCNLALFDGSRQEYTYHRTIYLPGPETSDTFYPTSVYAQDYSYILLNFPDRSSYILSRLGFWIGGSIILILVLTGLSVSLFFFYKQKFLIEVQNDFVNNFTHEFKTPLAVMKIAADVLNSSEIVHQPQRLEKYAKIITNETEHLENQVERLLKTAVSDRGNLKVRMDAVRVDELIHQTLSKLQPLIENRGVRVEVKLEEAYGLVVKADRVHLELALVNLIENAIKYSDQPVVIIEAGTGNSGKFISIKDNGIGIDEKYLKYIFNKFYRVPTGNVHNVKGFGLGLNFVKKIVSAHGGKIMVSSVPDIGTVFKIILPE